MTEQETIDLIDRSLVEEFELEPGDLKPEARLVDDLELDSLDFVDMVVVLQNAFSLKLRDDEGIRKIETLGDLHRFIIAKQQETEAGADS
jgi:acyl carrier protein